MQYEDGFKLGFMFNDKVYLNNHLYITVLFHEIERWVSNVEPLRLYCVV